jgi:rhamnulokinase
MDAAGDDRYAFTSLFDPDDPVFLHPPDMAQTIAQYCRRTGQPEPTGPASYTRAILESLAFKYRVVLDALQALTGITITELQIVGGGSRNRLLNQFTADATGRTVIAGPVEATALGNIAMQMVATGAVRSLAEARRIIERSFPTERFTPIAADRWAAHYRRFQEYVELSCV